jgi:Arc/MetJ-type ribon-helix-helix transcriptional regulator
MTDDDKRSPALSARVSLAISEQMNADIESELDATDSKSEWIREACRAKLDREQAQGPISE